MGHRMCPCFVLRLRLCLVDFKDRLSSVLALPCPVITSVSSPLLPLSFSRCDPGQVFPVLFTLHSPQVHTRPVAPVFDFSASRHSHAALPSTAAPRDSKVSARGSARHPPSAALCQVSVGHSGESLSLTGERRSRPAQGDGSESFPEDSSGSQA